VATTAPGPMSGPPSGAAVNSSSEATRLLLEVTTSRSRRVRDSLATVWMYGSFVAVVVPLAAILFYVVSKGLSAVLSQGWFTEDIPAVSRKPGGGMAPAIVGTLLITFGAAVLAVPIGIMGAIYLHEYGGRGRLARIIRFMADVMTGVPSIVMGLFIYVIWVLHFKNQTAFAGSLALACLMLPIVIRTSEEMLRLVPEELREGSYALGSRKVRAIRTVVLPHAAPGIVSGALLAVARAAGETAPLLFTIGIVTSTNSSLFHGPTTALSFQIFHLATSPFQGAQDRAYGAALTLILLVFVFTALARLVTALYARRATAGA
jgi:phosphate transport system permease protein